MAQAFHCRPSQLMNLENQGNDWLVWNLNKAVFRFGSFIRAKIDEMAWLPKSHDRNDNLEYRNKYTAEDIHEMIHGDFLTEAEIAEEMEIAGKIRSGDFNVTEIEEEAAYIPPKWRGKKLTITPESG